MNKRILYKKYFKEHWPSYLILILIAILMPISKISINIKWLNNLDVWLNHILANLMIFNIMQVITIKIKNQYLKGLINIIFTLILGQTLVFAFDYNMINKWTWLVLISSVFMYVGLSLQGFSNGIKKGKSKALEEYNKYIMDINKWSIENILDAVSSLKEAIQIVNEKPDASFWLLRLGNMEVLVSMLSDFESTPKYIEYKLNKTNK